MDGICSADADGAEAECGWLGGGGTWMIMYTSRVPTDPGLGVAS
jgi:hypothetical protein